MARSWKSLIADEVRAASLTKLKDPWPEDARSRIAELEAEVAEMRELLEESERRRIILIESANSANNYATQYVMELNDVIAELSEERALSADLARAVALYCPWEHSSLKNYMEKYPDWKTP